MREFTWRGMKGESRVETYRFKKTSIDRRTERKREGEGAKGHRCPRESSAMSASSNTRPMYVRALSTAKVSRR